MTGNDDELEYLNNQLAKSSNLNEHNKSTEESLNHNLETTTLGPGGTGKPPSSSNSQTESTLLESETKSTTSPDTSTFETDLTTSSSKASNDSTESTLSTLETTSENTSTSETISTTSTSDDSNDSTESTLSTSETITENSSTESTDSTESTLSKSESTSENPLTSTNDSTTSESQTETTSEKPQRRKYRFKLYILLSVQFFQSCYQIWVLNVEKQFWKAFSKGFELSFKSILYTHDLTLILIKIKFE